MKSRACISHGECSDHLTKPVGLCYSWLHAWLPAQAQQWPSEGVSVQRDSDNPRRGAERRLKKDLLSSQSTHSSLDSIPWALVTWLLCFVYFCVADIQWDFPSPLLQTCCVGHGLGMPVILPSIFFFQGRLAEFLPEIQEEYIGKLRK